MRNTTTKPSWLPHNPRKENSMSVATQPKKTPPRDAGEVEGGELKSCPNVKCGGMGEFVINQISDGVRLVPYGGHVECDNCLMAAPFDANTDEAIRSWNEDLPRFDQHMWAVVWEDTRRIATIGLGSFQPYKIYRTRDEARFSDKYPAQTVEKIYIGRSK